MKLKSIFIISFFGFFLPPINLSAQQWLQDAQQWSYTITGGWYPLDGAIQNLTVVGDTIIAGIECKTLLSYDRYHFAYAEHRAVYTYDPFAGDFFKIYDFLLLPGDTLEMLYGRKYRIDTIGIMDINGIDFRFQHISFFSTNFGNYSEHGPYLVLEGIGFIGRIDTGIPCSFFFINDIPCDSAVDGQDSNFQCFNEGNFTYDPQNLCTETALNEIHRPYFEVYPNPTSDFFTIESTTGHQPVSVTLYDFSGKLIWQGVPRNNRVNVQTLPHQSYMVKITDTDDNAYFSKIIICN